MSFTEKAKSLLLGKKEKADENNSVAQEADTAQATEMTKDLAGESGKEKPQDEDLQKAFEAFKEDYQAFKEEKQNQLAFLEKIKKLEKEFVKTHPDYDASTEFLKTYRLNELKQWGFDEASSRQIMNAEFAGLAKQAVESHLNPAEIAYRVATHKGYQQPHNTSSIEDLKENIKKTSSLGQVSGNPTLNANLENLADMPDDDFQAYWDQLVK